MRAMLCKELGEPSGLVMGDVAPPALGPGQARIHVHTAGVNFADTLIIAGKYQVRPDLPFAPGMEVAGVVADCAEGVTTCRPGDRVLATVSHGGYAEEAVAEADQVMVIPDGMDFAAAAGFPVVYGTSHLALDHRAHLRAGEVLLVHGAAGGVGLSAVEIGKVMGATVIACASSAEKLAVARDHGADHLIDTSTDSVRERVKEITGGADVIYDPVGGEAMTESLRCINWEGRVLVIGFASGTIPQIPANYLLLKNCAAIGLFWGAYLRRDADTIRLARESYATLLGWVAEGRLRPHVSHRFPLDQAADALALLGARKTTGKVVLTMGRD